MLPDPSHASSLSISNYKHLHRDWPGYAMGTRGVCHNRTYIYGPVTVGLSVILLNLDSLIVKSHTIENYNSRASILIPNYIIF